MSNSAGLFEQGCMEYNKEMEDTRQEVERIVAEVWESVPSAIRKKLENVEFFVEDGPVSNVLGFYHGVPFPHRKNPGYSLVMPDKIVLFKSSIERGCRTDRELRERISTVLLHEIGHYLGLDEEQLRSLRL